MNNEIEYHKLPWEIGQSSDEENNILYTIEGDGGYIVAETYWNDDDDKDNIKFIIRACNHHHQLIEAFEKVLRNEYVIKSLKLDDLLDAWSVIHKAK